MITHTYGPYDISEDIVWEWTNTDNPSSGKTSDTYSPCDVPANQPHVDPFYRDKFLSYLAFVEYHNKLLISLVFNVFTCLYYRRSQISKSGFLGRAGKRRKDV